MSFTKENKIFYKDKMKKNISTGNPNPIRPHDHASSLKATKKPPSLDRKNVINKIINGSNTHTEIVKKRKKGATQSNNENRKKLKTSPNDNLHLLADVATNADNSGRTLKSELPLSDLHLLADVATNEDNSSRTLESGLTFSDLHLLADVATNEDNSGRTLKLELPLSDLHILADVATNVKKARGILISGVSPDNLPRPSTSVGQDNNFSAEPPSISVTHSISQEEEEYLNNLKDEIDALLISVTHPAFMKKNNNTAHFLALRKFSAHWKEKLRGLLKSNGPISQTSNKEILLEEIIHELKNHYRMVIRTANSNNQETTDLLDTRLWSMNFVKERLGYYLQAELDFFLKQSDIR
ncbi:hypothetical protein [Erwinia pyrifoliae]|uniref:hypothetical protein n=1 Tax=Erwinia pyrifoliae TaxID=79967 RepID=UPI00223AB4FA|nr:hypothetical protein [Erwinia pyrifoliae]MCT2386187.1 hypothetical protein [Erwinia pyrifoliae]MCU8588216.1 hypothetical protein [Erwinia pyrifoliae]